MKRAGLVALLVWVCMACQEQSAPPKRADLREAGANTFEIIPGEGQLPYCLIYTHSETGVIRQLTMTHENKSVPCPAGKPVANVRFRIPPNEGEVKVHVLFSDQKLNAEAIAQDLYAKAADPSFHPMDLRLPGTVQIHTFEFVPRPDEAAATTGGRIGAGGEIVPPEATNADQAAEAGAPPQDAPTPQADAGTP